MKFHFILRALGYDDAAGDFSWDKSLDFAKAKGLIIDTDFNELSTATFYRDQLTKISYLALKMSLKDNDITLVEKLISMNAIDKKKVEEIGLMKIVSNDKSMTELTEADIERLQSYPYYGGEPKHDFEYYNTAIGPANEIIENFYELKPSPLKSNQVLLTSWQLTYRAGNNNYVLRGVLQEKLDNGTVLENDVEFAYKPYKYNHDTGRFDFVLDYMKILK